MNKNSITSINQLENKKLKNQISSDSYFEDSSEDEHYLLKNIIPKSFQNDYFNSSDSENEYKSKKPEIIYQKEDKHFGRVKIKYLNYSLKNYQEMVPLKKYIKDMTIMKEEKLHGMKQIYMIIQKEKDQKK